MKKVCAWCGKVITEEPGEGCTHGICRECFKKLEQEVREAYPEPDGGEPEPGPRDHGTLDDFAALLHDWGDLALALGILFGLILLGGSALHFLTGGWIPDPIQWLVEHPIGPLK